LIRTLLDTVEKHSFPLKKNTSLETRIYSLDYSNAEQWRFSLLINKMNLHKLKFSLVPCPAGLQLQLQIFLFFFIMATNLFLSQNYHFPSFPAIRQQILIH
jgi:hypothetical protein